QPRAGLDAGRNPDLQSARAAAPSLAAATAARLVHDAPLAPAGRAGPCHDEETLGEPLPAPSAAGRAVAGLRPLRGAGSRAGLAGFRAGNRERSRDAEGGVAERDLHAVAHVASRRTRRAAP